MTFHNILVNIDPLASTHPGFDQALDLASRSNATVTIADVLPDVPGGARRFVTDRVEQELVDHRWECLRAIAAAHPSRAVKTLLLRGTPAISIVEEVIRGGYDLLLKSRGHDPSAPPPPLTAVDMQLLRKCPCPVWLVSASASPHPRKILAAIDAGATDRAEVTLNRAIVDLALMVRDLEQAHLTLIYAWSVYAHDVLHKRMSEREFAAFTDAAKHTASDALRDFVLTLGEHRHGVTPALVEGEPHEVVPDYAEHHGIDLVVMGTVARTGLAGFVMGNTAERVIGRLGRSILAIKPPEFVSPVSSAARAARHR